MLPFARLKLEAPATAVNAPPHVLVAVGGAAITIPSGRLSVSAAVVSASAFAPVLRTLIVSVETPPTRSVAGLNDLLSAIDVTTRVTVALAAAALTKPSAVVTAPAAIVFVPEPAPAGVVMLTETVHEVAPVASVPPASEKLPAPEVAVTVPPTQVVAAFGFEDTECPAGSVSVNAMPENAGAPFACVNVTVSRESAPAATVAGANAFATVSAAVVVSVAVIADWLRP